ncbi:urease subunit alpha [Streptomyces sp. NPDC006261]|uniref:urease subunit alpha n=1 Tax=Streptomyces sp. NPDC006261 TaxID=3156739 RepID=UPI0033B7F9D5
MSNIVGQAPSSAASPTSPASLQRSKYATYYGPTAGDRFRLADTNLVVKIDQDWCGGDGRSGDEMLFGGGKVIRESMGMSHFPRRDTTHEPVDTVITGALIIDYWGVVKADVGLRNGEIAAIGQAYNPETMSPMAQDPANTRASNFVVGPETEVVSGNGRILTAGGIDTHVHFLGPGQIHEALASGVTTLIGGGTGPAEGSRATTMTPGEWHIRRTFEALDAYPVNIGLFGKGGTVNEDALKDQILAGTIGLKIHEDWGATPAAIDKALEVCATYGGAQVALHADSMNESGFVEDTFNATKDRSTGLPRGIHVFHVEGAGGGHAPDIMKLAGKGYESVLPASTNPTRPLTVNTVAEHMYMMVICHHLNLKVDADRQYADSRIRPSTMAAEDWLHDTGAISMMSSDSQAMGRIGEMIMRTWQTAHVMKKRRGPLQPEPGCREPADDQDSDNFRIRRYIAKYTINPALAHGINKHVGSVEPKKVADLVLWEPKFFGVKPHMIIKGGQIAYAQLGDANASIPTPQPYLPRPVWGSCGRAPGGNSFNFVVDHDDAVDIKKEYELTKGMKKITSTRGVAKGHMKLNSASPDIKIGPDAFDVTIGSLTSPGVPPGVPPGTPPGAGRGTTTDAVTVLKDYPEAPANPQDKQMFAPGQTPDPELYESELPMAQRYFLF